MPELMSSDFTTEWLIEFLHGEVTKMTLAFIIAAWLHRRWVKKDMAQQFGLIRDAINHVAEVMAGRIDGLDARVNRLERKKVRRKKKK